MGLHHQAFGRINKTAHTFLFMGLANLFSPSSAAGVPNCTSVADKWIDNPHNFELPSWINRGICVRVNDVSDGVTTLCYKALQLSMNNFDDIRNAEYAAATTVLTLLPTIGALLGAPTAEIWRLVTVIPFGGFLAMTLSFGGVILPVRIKDYELDANGQRTTVGRSVTSMRHATSENQDPEAKNEGSSAEVVNSIRARIQQDESQRLAKGHIWTGLLVMFVLWCGAQAVMVIIEQGAVIIWYCTWRWWMHMWYFLGQPMPRAFVAMLS